MGQGVIAVSFAGEAETMHIEILYFEGCPNHAPTVELVKRTVANLGVQAQIEEVEVASPEQVEQLRFLGSPTVLVDGVDIEPEVGCPKTPFLGRILCPVFGPGNIARNAHSHWI